MNPINQEWTLLPVLCPLNLTWSFFASSELGRVRGKEKQSGFFQGELLCAVGVPPAPWVLLQEQLQVCFGAVVGIQGLCQLQPNQLGCSLLKFGAGSCPCSAVPLACSGEFFRGTCTPNSPCSAKSTDNGLAGNNAGLQLPLPPVLQAQALQGTFLALCLNSVWLGVPRKASVAGAVIYEVLVWAVTVSHMIHAVPSKDPLLSGMVWITSLSSL